MRQNNLKEALPHHFFASLTESQAMKGWRSKPYRFFGEKQNTVLGRVARRTAIDLESGWDGGLAIGNAKETKRHKPHTFFQRSDVPTFGASDRTWDKLRFRGSWKQRQTQGWSAKAIVTWYCLNAGNERKEHEGWSIGCPSWWEDHQP